MTDEEASAEMNARSCLSTARRRRRGGQPDARSWILYAALLGVGWTGVALAEELPAPPKGSRVRVTCTQIERTVDGTILDSDEQTLTPAMDDQRQHPVVAPRASITKLEVLWTASQAPPQAVKREGFIVGVGLSAGAMWGLPVNLSDKRSSGAAVGLQIQLGGMVGSRLAILADVSGMSHTESQETKVTRFIGPAVQVFVTDRFWLKAGVGIGMANRTSGGFLVAVPGISILSAVLLGVGENPSTGLGLLAAAGVEVVQGRRFALDVQGRFETASVSDSLPGGYRDVRVTTVIAALALNVY